MAKQTGSSAGARARGGFPYTRGRSAALRDYLAIDRTVLANERTLLSYMRTALALAVVGASAIKFFDEPWLEILGWLFVALGLLTSAYGARRFAVTLARIREAVDAVSEGVEGSAS